MQSDGSKINTMVISSALFRSIHARLQIGLACTALLIYGCARPVQPMPASVPTTSPPKLPPVVSVLPTIQFTIQVGAFSTIARAARYAEQMRSAGLDAYFFVDTDGLYKVRFERFDAKAAARRRAAALQTEGLIADFFIVRPGPTGSRVDPHERLRESLVTTAQRFIGIPYRWGGASASQGFDCSGLAMTVYRLNGLDLPRNTYSQYRAGTPIPRNALAPGDLVFFATGRSSRISHVGIYMGRERFIHAPGRGKRIRTAALTNSYFQRRYKGARRYY